MALQRGVVVAHADSEGLAWDFDVSGSLIDSTRPSETATQLSSGTYDFTGTATLLLKDPTLAPLFSITPDFTGSLSVPSRTTLTSSSIKGSAYW